MMGGRVGFDANANVVLTATNDVNGIFPNSYTKLPRRTLVSNHLLKELD